MELVLSYRTVIFVRSGGLRVGGKVVLRFRRSLFAISIADFGF